MLHSDYTALSSEERELCMMFDQLLDNGLTTVKDLKSLGFADAEIALHHRLRSSNKNSNSNDDGTSKRQLEDEESGESTSSSAPTSPMARQLRHSKGQKRVLDSENRHLEGLSSTPVGSHDASSYYSVHTDPARLVASPSPSAPPQTLTHVLQPSRSRGRLTESERSSRRKQAAHLEEVRGYQQQIFRQNGTEDGRDSAFPCARALSYNESAAGGAATPSSSPEPRSSVSFNKKATTMSSNTALRFTGVDVLVTKEIASQLQETGDNSEKDTARYLELRACGHED